MANPIVTGLDAFFNSLDPTMRARRTIQAEQAERLNPVREAVLNMTARQQPFAGVAPMDRGPAGPSQPGPVQQPGGPQQGLMQPAAPQGGAVVTPLETPPELTPPPEIDAILQQAAQKHGVPVNALRALAAQESSFNPQAVNQPTPGDPTDPGAFGLLQFTEETARDMGIDPNDPVQAADATAAMLRRRLDAGLPIEEALTRHFGGDNTAFHGPNTERFRQEITDKFQRLQGAGQQAPQAGAQQQPQQAAPQQQGPFGTRLAPVPADQNPVHKLLASFASDPKTFAEQFAGEGGVEQLTSMLSGGGQAGDAFTLSPGQARFDASGRPIAALPDSGGERTLTAVVSGDSPAGQRLVLRPGERRRVKRKFNDAGVVVEESVLGEGGGTNVSVDLGRDEFAEANAKTINDELAATLERGRLAQASLGTFDQAADLLRQGVQTGRGQSMILPIRQLAEDFGVSLEGAAEKLGIPLGDGNTLTNQEDFQRLTTQLMLDSFQQFKGNLNQREVEMAENSVANIGTSEEANMRAIAAMRAAAELAVERREGALRSIASESREDSVNYLLEKTRASTDEFRERMNRHLEQMQGSRPEAAAQRATGREGPAQPAAPTAPGAPPSISSDEEYEQLPSGATFRAPDGTLRRKP